MFRDAVWQMDMGRYNHRIGICSSGSGLDARHCMGMVVMDEDHEEVSFCCGAYFCTEVVDGIGMCGDCKEWSEVYTEEDDE